MKKLIPIALLSMIFFACGGSEETSEGETNDGDTSSVDTVSVDTIVEVEPVRIEINVNNLLSKVDSTFELPLTVDSSFVLYAESMMEYEDEGGLTPDEVEYMGFELVDNHPSSMASFSFDDFAFMDSINSYDLFDEYMETIDIAMTTYADAKILGKAPIGPDSYYIIWTTAYATLEACPYGSGTYIWATLFANDQATNTALIGESSGGADAPYWGDTFTTGVLDRSELSIHVVDQKGGEYDEEADEEIVERSEADYKVWVVHDWFEADKDE